MIGTRLASRRLAALILGAMTGYAVVALYQFRLAGEVPEPCLPGLSARRVDASGEAYAAGHMVRTIHHYPGRAPGMPGLPIGGCDLFLVSVTIATETGDKA